MTVYDAGVLVAADRGNRAVWADHRVRLETGVLPTTTAPVVAQVSRSARQAQLRRFLRGCQVVAFTPDEAHDVGMLVAATSTSDVVDAHIVLVAARSPTTIITSDPHDLELLAAALSPTVTVRTVAT